MSVASPAKVLAADNKGVMHVALVTVTQGEGDQSEEHCGQVRGAV